MTRISLPKTALAILFQTSVLAVISLALLYYRLQQLAPSTFNGCMDDSMVNIQSCIQQVTIYYLTEPTWLARQFTLLILPASVISYLFCYQTPRTALAQTFGIAVVTSILLLMTLDNGLLAPVSSFAGSMLSGLFIHRRSGSSVTLRPS